LGGYEFTKEIYNPTRKVGAQHEEKQEFSRKVRGRTFFLNKSERRTNLTSCGTNFSYLEFRKEGPPYVSPSPWNTLPYQKGKEK